MFNILMYIVTIRFILSKLYVNTDMIRQFLANVYWGETDYLIIDTPPGTSDEHMAVVENVKHLNPDGAILVTTPQVGRAICVICALK